MTPQQGTQQILKPDTIINNTPVSQLEQVEIGEDTGLLTVRPPERMIAALFVLDNGPYFGIPNVDAWGIERDARKYPGPYPVIAHPPCARWGKLWFGGMGWKKRKGYNKKLGDDNGCFLTALAAVRRYGGVLEHPKHTNAYKHFGINRPPKGGGWGIADDYGGLCCEVDQRWYGHPANKMTWLYCYGLPPPELKRGRGPASEHVVVISNPKLPKHRDPLFEEFKTPPTRSKATGTKGLNQYDRSATPAPFKQLLIDMAESVDLDKYGGYTETLFGQFQGDSYEVTMKTAPPPGVDWALEEYYEET